jgi:hypothetical protein
MAPLAARGDGHIAADQEGEPAEHLLLGQLGIAPDELSDASGELLVVGHGNDRTERCGPATGALAPASQCSCVLFAYSASTAPTTLLPSVFPGQPCASAALAVVIDLATADLDFGIPHPDLALFPIRPRH